MIDLNYQEKAADSQQTEETPIGLVILGSLPFAAGFIWMVFQAILA